MHISRRAPKRAKLDCLPAPYTANLASRVFVYETETVDQRLPDGLSLGRRRIYAREINVTCSVIRNKTCCDGVKRMIRPCIREVGYFTVAAPSIADCNVAAATKFSVMATDDRTFITACHLKWKHHLIW